MNREIYDFKKYRYYNKSTNSIIAVGNDFYGNVKISYRAVIANLAIQKEILSLHSVCLQFDETTIAITGDSGAGKSTLFDLIDKEKDSVMIWEDFGLIDSRTNELIIPGEGYNQIKFKTLQTMFPRFSDYDSYHTEFFDERNPFFNERRIMVNFSHYRKTFNNSGVKQPIKLDVLIIVVNDTDEPFKVEKISADTAIKVFSKPAYSKAHQNEIVFANGSLILDETLHKYNEKLFHSLFKNLPLIVLVNNNYTEIDSTKIYQVIREANQSTKLR